MKKIVLSIIFAIMMSLCANAQTDAIVSNWDYSYRAEDDEFPWIPYIVVGGITQDINANNSPLGDGILMLMAFGTGYLMIKKKRKNM